MKLNNIDYPDYVETNIGKMPLVDYLDMCASQNGFDSYEEMYNQGYRIPDYKDLDPKYLKVEIDKENNNDVDDSTVDIEDVVGTLGNWLDDNLDKDIPQNVIDAINNAYVIATNCLCDKEA